MKEINIVQTQDTVADEINTIYNEMADMAQKTIDKAIYIGELLYYQKQQLKYGEFIPWVEQNLSFDRQQASKYIKLYSKQDILNVASTQHFGLESGLAQIRQTEKLEKKQQLEQTKQQIEEEKQDDFSPPLVTHADYKDWLKEQNPCDLLLTDPPYSTDLEDVETFAKEWLPLALDKVNPTGRAFVFIGAYAEELQAYLNITTPTQILVWTYRNTLGPSPKKDFKLNWQAILYFRMSDAPELNCSIMTEQFSVQDVSAPDGRHGIRYHEWQKPDELAERFVRYSTKPNDLVLDPFCCTGTFLLAANRLGREGRGCDIDIENLEIAEKRGCQIQNKKDVKLYSKRLQAGEAATFPAAKKMMELIT